MRKAARREQARREKARRHILPFCQFIDSDYQDVAHVRMLAEHLRQVEQYVETGGKQGIGRLIITMPPRHGKSQMTSKRWPAFLLGRHPNWHLGIVAYNAGFAQDFGRANRELCDQSTEYHQLFPGLRVDPSSSAVDRWALKGVDPDAPSFVAVGVGGPLTGRGFQVIGIDDPVKNREEAESKTYRTRLHRFYNGTLRTRLEPGGAVVITVTRWHQDDLPGHLLALVNEDENAEKWTVLNLPAIAVKGDPLGRKIGAALWPERFDKEALAALRSIGTYEWEAQYQGNPRPPEGTHLQRGWFQYTDKPPDGLQWFRYYDLAISAKETASFTATGRGALDDEGNLYIASMIHERLKWPAQKKMIKSTMLAERDLEVRHRIEKALHGEAALQEFLSDSDLVDVELKGVTVSKDKLTRALPWIARAEARQVILVRGLWNAEFLDEVVDFTGHNDLFDDQADVVSGIVAAIAQQKSPEVEEQENPFYD